MNTRITSKISVLILVSVMTLALAFCDVAQADILYTVNNAFGCITVTNNGANGIEADVNPLVTNTGAGANAKIFGFSQYGSSYIVLTVPGLGIDGYDQARIYNVNSLSFNSAEQNANYTPTVVTLEGIFGACALVEAGNAPSSTVFIVGQDSGNVVEFENMVEDWPSRERYDWAQVWPDVDCVTTGVDVLVNRYVYSLFRRSDGNSDLNGSLIVTDGRLASGDLYVSCDVGPNPSGMVNTSGTDAVIAYRGDSASGISGGVDQLVQSKVTNLISNDIGSVEAIASDGNNGFYFVSVKNNAAKLYRWKSNSGANGQLEIPSVSLRYTAGDKIQLVWDTGTNVLAILCGNEIWLLNNEEQVQYFTSASFGNTPTSISTVTQFSSGDDGGGGGSCNLGFAGLMGFALVSLLARRSRQE